MPIFLLLAAAAAGLLLYEKNKTTTPGVASTAPTSAAPANVILTSASQVTQAQNLLNTFITNFNQQPQNSASPLTAIVPNGDPSDVNTQTAAAAFQAQMNSDMTQGVSLGDTLAPQQFQTATGVPWSPLRIDGVLDTNTLAALGFASTNGW